MRVTDNVALLKSVAQSRGVAAMFVIEPGLLRTAETSAMHLHSWWDALTALQQALRDRGGELYFPEGEVVEVLDTIHGKSPLCALFSHEETGSSITYQRDIAVAAWCGRQNVVWREFPQNGVIRGLLDRSERQSIIRERLIETDVKPAPESIPPWKIDGWSTTLPTIEMALGRGADPMLDPRALQRVNEAAGQRDLSSFLHDRGVGYAGGISSPNTADVAGSRLSAHLAWGTLSLRDVFAQTRARQSALSDTPGDEAKQWGKSLRAFRSRLHWHDHFIQRLESEPEMEFRALSEPLSNLDYRDSADAHQRWLDGLTGLPMLDAAMRCLRATGFINFRMRAMIVTTLCFGFRQSWHSLLHPLASVFNDYEPGIHIAQTQMQASVVGINTVRIYSPHKQLLDQDPDCIFVKRWIPELRRFAPRSIADYEHRQLGNYPSCNVDIKANANLMRSEIYAIRKTEKGRAAAAEVLEKHGSRRPSSNKRRRTTAAQSEESSA